MGSNSIIVREYLSSLKEDRELDYLFPLLLNVMGFRIISTAREAKGQSQYGKDIIAVNKDEKGTIYKYYFELKGYKDRDITDSNFFGKDGIYESIIEAKYTAFNDSSVTGFNHLPVKVVVVHNGILKTNVRPTFEGVISREFKDGEFERWDIYYLTDLFSKYMFSEYLLADDESNRYFKRTLALLDTPDYDFIDFKHLINLQIDRIEIVKERALKKFFATLSLLASIVYTYSKENDNLHPAKECVNFLILRTWAWILKEKLENKRSILNSFRILLRTQYFILNEYFKKTFPAARIENGLFAENGGPFESIGYPLRSFEYLGDLIYYCQMRLYYPHFKSLSSNAAIIRDKQKDLILELIDNNDSFNRPLLDNHSIPISLLFLFFTKEDIRQKDLEFIAKYIFNTLDNIHLIKLKKGRYPELYNRINLVSEYNYTKNRPAEYEDNSSILIAVLFEFIAVMNGKDHYEVFRKNFLNSVNLQIAQPNVDDYDIEQRLFEGPLHEEYYVEHGIQLQEDYDQFVENIMKKKTNNFFFRTDKAGFPYLRTLAYHYYHNEVFPMQWRDLINKETAEETNV